MKEKEEKVDKILDWSDKIREILLSKRCKVS